MAPELLRQECSHIVLLKPVIRVLLKILQQSTINSCSELCKLNKKHCSKNTIGQRRSNLTGS